MVRITFARIGHANNSSSNHSIIFFDEKEKIPNDAFPGDYGWDNFILTSEEDKELYIKLCLRYNFCRNTTIESDNEDIKNNFNKYVENEGFESFIKKYFPYLAQIKIKENDYIDHQSVIYFPEHRLKGGIDFKFADKFIDYFLSNNFVIIGGNDNDSGHPLSNFNDHLEKDFRHLWSILRESRSLVVFDELNNEFVIRFENGNLYKVIIK